MRFASLGSGSEGNALVVESGSTRVLMDCGFTLRETHARLARLGLLASDLDGILVTHEHGDHIGGVARLARQLDIPIWLTHGTQKAHDAALFGLQLSLIDPHNAFSIGELHVQPYAVPHDAAEPVQYVFGDGARRLGVLTDAGCITQHIEAVLSGCEALVLECNHDPAMLAGSDYPQRLKLRIGGRFGHLSNPACSMSWPRT